MYDLFVLGKILSTRNDFQLDTQFSIILYGSKNRTSINLRCSYFFVKVMEIFDHYAKSCNIGKQRSYTEIVFIVFRVSAVVQVS
jgi:hypothetical protein